MRHQFLSILSGIAFFPALILSQGCAATTENPTCRTKSDFASLCCPWPSLCYYVDRSGRPGCCPAGQTCRTGSGEIIIANGGPNTIIGTTVITVATTETVVPPVPATTVTTSAIVVVPVTATTSTIAVVPVVPSLTTQVLIGTTTTEVGGLVTIYSTVTTVTMGTVTAGTVTSIGPITTTVGGLVVANAGARVTLPGGGIIRTARDQGPLPMIGGVMAVLGLLGWL